VQKTRTKDARIKGRKGRLQGTKNKVQAKARPLVYLFTRPLIIIPAHPLILRILIQTTGTQMTQIDADDRRFFSYV
jgi:hypothetical protein